MRLKNSIPPKVFLFSAIFFIAAVIIAGILQPIYSGYIKDTWNNVLTGRLNYIESGILEDFNSKVETAIELNNKVRMEIRDAEISDDSSLRQIFDVIVKNEYNSNTIALFNDSNELMVWNINADGFENSNPQGDYGFYNSDLVTYLTISKNVDIGGKTYFLITGIPIEKHFNIRNEYYIPLSFSDDLTEKFGTKIELNYSPAESAADGRLKQIDIKNGSGKIIGNAVIYKPSRDARIISINESFANAQQLFALLAFISVVIFSYYGYIKYKSRQVKIIFLISVLAALRIILYVFEIPSSYFTGGITDPEFFSSRFAWGIVRSPLEFFVTNVFVLITFYLLFRLARLSYDSGTQNYKWYRYIVLAAGAFFYLLSYRAFGASVKSVIFDSSYRYFNSQSLIPEFPAAVMQLSILILGVSSLFFSLAVLYFVLSYFRKDINKNFIKTFFTLFVIFQFAGVLFDMLQNEPQGTPIVRIIYILLSFILFYYLAARIPNYMFLYLYISLSASFLSAMHLIHFNRELQKESIKTIAYDFTRPDLNWLEFLLNEILIEIDKNEKVNHYFTSDKNYNYDAEAFKVWSNSGLQRESVSSELSFLSRQGRYLGGFSFRFDPAYRLDFYEDFNLYTEITLFRRNIYETDNIVIYALMPVKENNNVVGYVQVSAINDFNSFAFAESPEFLSAKRNFLNSAVSFTDLKIFEFRSGEMVKSLGNANIIKSQEELIKNIKLNDKGEYWAETEFNNEPHLLYVRNFPFDTENVIAIALKSKELTISVFDFFKIFFLHSLIIFSVFLIFLTVYFYKAKEVKVNFRFQLLIAFLVISLIPLILMAVFFRNLTEEKNNAAVFYKLGKRAQSVEEYLQRYSGVSTLTEFALYNKAGEDLGVDFTLFSGKELFYSSEINYYDVGLMPPKLNPTVYKEFNYNGFVEFVTQENIDNYKYNSFYFKTRIGEREFIIKVSDAFNSILLPMSATDVDIFLFGSYFIAVVIIIIVSTLLANQIGAPIRLLTKATGSVASGDLNVEILWYREGEIKELIDGFNHMVKRLKSNQKQLAEMERESAWKEMAKQVAHEIKNPLTPMKLSVQQLQAAKRDNSPKFDSIFEKVTGTIVKQIETLKNIASEFSNFARMPNLKVEKTDISVIINETIDLFLDESANVTIESAIEQCYVNADKDHLKRTLINLIRNSIQADAKNVIVGCKKEGLYYSIRVKDDGKGIAEDVVNRIFEADFTTKIKGMGLGLSMAKRYIESIEGEIKVEETSGKGTVILIKLNSAE